MDQPCLVHTLKISYNIIIIFLESGKKQPITDIENYTTTSTGLFKYMSLCGKPGLWKVRLIKMIKTHINEVVIQSDPTTKENHIKAEYRPMIRTLLIILLADATRHCFSARGHEHETWSHFLLVERKLNPSRSMRQPGGHACKSPFQRVTQSGWRILQLSPLGDRYSTRVSTV